MVESLLRQQPADYSVDKVAQNIWRMFPIFPDPTLMYDALACHLQESQINAIDLPSLRALHVKLRLWSIQGVFFKFIIRARLAHEVIVENGICRILKKKLFEMKDFWKFVTENEVRKLVIYNDDSLIEYEEIAFGKLAKIQPTAAELTETFTLTWQDGARIEETKANLMLCGNFFIPLIRNAFREGGQSSTHMAVGSPAILSEILQEVKKDVRDSSVRHNEFVEACNFFLYESVFPKLPDGAFGKKMWEKYFGEVGIEPPLPLEIDKILKEFKSPILVMIPATVNDKPFCLDLLEELINNPKEGNVTRYRRYSNFIKNQYGKKTPEKSYWFLMESDVMDGSLALHRNRLLAMASSRERCQAPELLEAATAILMHFKATGKKIFSESPERYTCCQEFLDDDVIKFIFGVGRFSNRGIEITNITNCGYNNGIALSRKF